MIGYLIVGIVIGLIPAAILFVLVLHYSRELDSLEHGYANLEKHRRQLYQKAEFAKEEAATAMAILGEAVKQRDAESERASANSERVQQLQDELAKQRDYRRRIDQAVA